LSAINWAEEAKIHGKRLKAVRQSLGLSKVDMADVLEVTHRRITAIETGERRMNEKDFEMIGIHFPWFLRFVVYGGPWETPIYDDDKSIVGFKYLPQQDPASKEQLKAERDEFRKLGQKMLEIFGSEEVTKEELKKEDDIGVPSTELSAQNLENAANILFNMSQKIKLQEDEEK